jgi:hypothetical protein
VSTYLIFFGKSQDFTTCYYDRDSPIHDFNTVIKDFDLLESKIFTVDDLKNKEILSRYFFTAQGKSYCLLKLYSFAQAFSGNRIAGSIYGVGLLCDKAIDFSKKNTELLRVAKDNFAKLSLDGAKFKKSNFNEETDRIWKAIVLNSDGNLLDKIATSPLKINKSESQVSYFVKDLFSDAIKLNDRISNLDAVYFSEDLEHLKRTQNKWGKETFPIYWEQNNQFVSYKETVVDQKSKSVHNVPGNDYSKSQDTNLSKLRADLSEYQFINQNHQHVLKKLKGKQKFFAYVIYGLSCLLICLLLYVIFFSGDSEEKVEYQPDPISNFLTDDKTLDSGIVFLKSARYIYSFNVKKSRADSSKFHKQFQSVQNIAASKNILIDNINEIYLSKSDELRNTVSAEMEVDTLDQNSKKLEEEIQKNNSN